MEKNKIKECYFEYITETGWDNPFEREAYAINVNKAIEKEIKSMPEEKIVECFCCEKEFKESEIIKIEARKDEFRFICKNCNHLKEK